MSALSSHPSVDRSYRSYLDNSNFLIEGQRISALRRGWARDIRESFDRQILDTTWRPSYGTLGSKLEERVGTTCARDLFGSLSRAIVEERANEIRAEMQAGGWSLHLRSRESERPEKGVDVELATHLTWDAALRTDRMRTGLLLVAGDRDYAPMVEFLTARGHDVVVAFWAHAAEELKQAASRFVELDHCFHDVTASPRLRGVDSTTSQEVVSCRH